MLRTCHECKRPTRNRLVCYCGSIRTAFYLCDPCLRERSQVKHLGSNRFQSTASEDSCNDCDEQ
jgi:hypothetical protein